MNQKQNSDAQWGFDSANYGLFIDVSGGTKNYGICSNAALIAPSFVGTKASILTFDSGSYKVDFSQCNVILMYYNDPNYSGTNVELPGELSVAVSSDCRCCRTISRHRDVPRPSGVEEDHPAGHLQPQRGARGLRE